MLVLSPTLLAAAGTPKLITVGSNPAQNGYAVPSVGSISPNGSLRQGAIIQTLSSPPTSEFGFDFQLYISGIFSQSLFRYLLVQETPSVLRFLASAAAVYENPGGADSLWMWGDGSNRVWGGTSVGLVRSCAFHW